MPKKQKIDKRLNQLFKDIQPEEAPSKQKRTNVTEEAKAVPLPEAAPAKGKRPKTGPLSIEPIAKSQAGGRQSAAAPRPKATDAIGSRMALTFQAGQQDWATLQIVDEAAPRTWSQDEQLLVKQVTDQLSLALENARLFQETQERAAELAKRAAQLKAVADISAAVSTILNLQELLQASVNLIRQKFDLYHCHVFMLMAGGKMLSVQACGWEEGDPRAGTHGVREIELDQEVSLVARAARTRQAVVINDVTSAPDWLPNQYLPRVKSEMAIPLIAGDKLLGVLNVHSDKLGFFTEEDVSIQVTLASQIAVAIDNARLFQETQQLNQAIQSSNDAIVTTDLNGKIMQVNSAFTETTGYQPEEVVGKTPRILKSNLQPPQFYQKMWSTIMDGEIWRSELINKRKDGSLYTVDQTILPVRDKEGSLIGFLSVERDITDKKRSEEALARSEADLRALFAAMEDVVLVLDKDGRYTRIAPTSPSHLVRPPDELLGKLIEEVIDKETAAYFMAAIKHTLETGATSQLEYELPVGDQIFWFLASISKLSEDQVFWVARDITERKKAEQALTRFKLGIENSGDAVFMTTISGEIIYANPAFESVYGFKPEEVIGRNPRIIKSGLVPPEQYQQFWKTLLSKKTASGEITNKTKDGRLVNIAGTNSPILDEKGNILGFLAVHHDITNLKEAEERLHLIVETVPIPILISAVADGTVLFANGELGETFGTPSEQLIGRKTPDFYRDPSDRQALLQTLKRDGSLHDYELAVKKADGTPMWMLVSMQPISFSGQPALLTAFYDVTERREAEEALKRRNNYLAASAEIGRLITSTLDLNTIFGRTVNLINERFDYYHAAIFIVEETGFNAILREATGEAGTEMKRQKHTLAVDSNSIVGKVTAQGSPIVVNNTTLDPLHKKNPLLPETKAEAAIPLRIGNRIIGALDIQSTKVDAFTEDEIGVLQTLADQVAVAIDNARSYELSQQAVMEMREIDRLKSQFLANMSHELRTPLNSIIGFSRVILKGIDGPVTELQQQDLTAIYNSGQHLLSLINDILDLAKIEAGKMELAFDEVNMADVTNSVLSTMTGLIKDKAITLKRNIQPNLPTVRADAIRIRQVMINLLSNAAKFTEEGEIMVDVAIQPGQGGRPEMMVSVIDTGPGITPQDQAKLFQPFSQVDDSPTRKTGGTGLGLSICQNLIHMHGGRIGVHSALGKGSTFYFTLPLYRKERETENSGNHGKVILAIDDDPQVIGLYERYLQPQGYQVISLTDPSRAVDRVRQLKPFAVTLDIMMPGIDGWQVLSNLKSNAETRDVPVIICSIIEDQEKGFSLGAADYLVKPILEEDLVNALDRLNADGSIHEVLVIDDDPNDLRLIGKMLTDDGRYKPILAQGGVKGWEILSSKSPPQAVILDLFMPDLDGFRLIENMRGDQKLRDLPVIVMSGVELTAEQKQQLDEFGQRLLMKGSFNEKELFTLIQRSLQRVPLQ